MFTQADNETKLERSLGVFHTSFGASTATNNTLRMLLLIFAGISLVEGMVISKLGNTIANQRPVIIRVDSLGKAIPVGYEDDLKPRANEVKYFVTQFVNYKFSRTHDPRLPISYSRSYAFLSQDMARKQFAYDQQTKWLPKFLESADPDTKVSVDNILVRNLDHAPYEVTVRLTEQFLGTSGAPVKADEHHDVTIHFDFAQLVPNEVVQINPLGLIINSPIQDDRTFSN